MRDYETSELYGDAIQLLLERSGMHIYQGKKFFANGQMQQSFRYLGDRLGMLSSGEALLWKVANELWAGEFFEAKLADLVGIFNPQLVATIVSLYLAIWHGNNNIKAWISNHQRKP